VREGTVINDAQVSALVCARNVSQDLLIELEPGMGGEDFFAYRQVVQGCFFVVGGRADAFPHHHRRFAGDEQATGIAIDVFVATTLNFRVGGINA
jgi:metal-dependent amidase/aminoacylase/carboxypeptidase family protein